MYSLWVVSQHFTGTNQTSRCAACSSLPGNVCALSTPSYTWAQAQLAISKRLAREKQYREAFPRSSKFVLEVIVAILCLYLIGSVSGKGSCAKAVISNNPSMGRATWCCCYCRRYGLLQLPDKSVPVKTCFILAFICVFCSYICLLAT